MADALQFGPLFQRVTLDANGNGTVRFQAVGVKWEIMNLSVIVATNTNEALATVYKGQVGNFNRISGSYAGSTGDNNNDTIYLNDGESIYIVWTGGDVGAVATATISGWQSVPERGFRAVH